MKLILIIAIFCLFSTQAFSQKDVHNKYLKLSAGRMLFGTGDIVGYAANVEYAKRLNSGKMFLKHFAMGAELSFENGATEPDVYTTPAQESFNRSFHTTTNIVFTPKFTYYPFNKTFAKGINITGGISVGFTSQSREFQSGYTYDPVFQRSVRHSYLAFYNKAMFGYRITTGYEFMVTKKIVAGARLDFDSYENGDINTLIGLKAGIRF